MSSPTSNLQVNLGYIRAFLDHLRKELRRPANTVMSYYYDIGRFFMYCKNFCEQRGVQVFNLSAVTSDFISNYLQSEVMANLAPRSKVRHAYSIATFYNYLLLHGIVSDNPVKVKRLPKFDSPEPKVLTREEVAKLMAVPDLRSDVELRYRTMLELIYATGMRTSEVLNLVFDDIDFGRGIVRVKGKGGYYRFVPLTNVAIYYLREWLIKCRFNYQRSELVFSTRKGTRIDRGNFWKRIKQYAQKAGIDSKGFGAHTLRHSFATHLLQAGADLRTIQILLGHKSLNTTTIYTHLTMQDLREIYDKNDVQFTESRVEALRQVAINYQKFAPSARVVNFSKVESEVADAANQTVVTDHKDKVAPTGAIPGDVVSLLDLASDNGSMQQLPASNSLTEQVNDNSAQSLKTAGTTSAKADESGTQARLSDEIMLQDFATLPEIDVDDDLDD